MKTKNGNKISGKNKYVDVTYSRAKIVYCVILCSDALFFDKTKEKNCACVSFLYFGRPLENVFFSHEPQPQRPMTFGESTEAAKDRGV